MKPEQIPFRTAKGDQMVASHSRELSTAQRRALIAVDGKTSLADLAARVVWVENLEAVLQELCNLGLVTCDLVEMQHAHQHPVNSGLVQKARLVELAHSLLGPHAERIIKKINEAQDTRDALGEALIACQKFIKLAVDSKLASDFLRRAQEILDS
ncbi:MAG: hypothetical protein M0T86_03275 [Betaproteobacteria bacterium]|nr:hypothetical protein [Betaproteobacteria bacterium]